MAVRVDFIIPSMLTRFTDGERKISLRADTVGEALTELISRHPELRVHLYNSDGLRSHLQIYYNGRMIDTNSDINLRDGDKLMIIQAVSGG